jgi:hypothetical protein
MYAIILSGYVLILYCMACFIVLHIKYSCTFKAYFKAYFENIHAEIAKHKNKAQVKLKSIQSKKAAVRQISCNVYSRIFALFYPV